VLVPHTQIFYFFYFFNPSFPVPLVRDMHESVPAPPYTDTRAILECQTPGTDPVTPSSSVVHEEKWRLGIYLHVGLTFSNCAQKTPLSTHSTLPASGGLQHQRRANLKQFYQSFRRKTLQLLNLVVTRVDFKRPERVAPRWLVAGMGPAFPGCLMQQRERLPS